MSLVKEPDTEPIPGYRLIEFLGQGGFGEVWKCEAPGGLFKAIKFVRGNLHSLDAERLQAEQEWKALQLVKAIRHPFLLGMDRLEVVGGELVIVMELADSSLAEAARACREAGLSGIPRAELLAYLREAAEALDVINLQHHLQHLDVKPANLLLVNRHVKVGDFGMLNRLGDGNDPAADGAPGGLTPLYCAPETLTGTVSRRSDQYSLAVVYQELLTGRLPFAGRNARELLLRRATGAPDLSPLPAAQRPIVERALSRDPEARYSSCTEFVRALAPELMPANSSPFLDGLLADEAAAPPRAAAGRSGTRPGLTHPTLRLPGDGTPARPGAPAPRRPPEPPPADVPDFAGHRLLKCLGRGPLCETWKVQAPDGRPRLLKFPNGLSDGGDPAEAEALRFLTQVVHPNVLPVEVVKNDAGRIAFVCAAMEGTLADRLQHCQTVGLPGIPRRELLDHLHAAAAALDALYREYRLQHLCLTPRTLVLDGQRLLVADVGLGQLLWVPAGQLNGRYSAPELCAGEISPTCDQYSLAVIYQEMLTGTSPFRGGPARGKARPNLDLLPAPDREAIARALSPNPERRFATCEELLDALDGGAATHSASQASAVLPPVIPVPGPSPAAATDAPLPHPRELIAQMLAGATGQPQLHEAGALRYLLGPGAVLKHTCGASLSVSLAGLKLEGFRQQWNADLVSGKAGAFVLEVPLSGSFLQRCFGQQPALAIHLHLTPPRGRSATLTGVRVEVRPVRCGREQAVAALAQHGPPLLHSLRTFLQAEPGRRAQGRVPFGHALGVFPVLDGPQLGDALVCQGKDLSPGGLGFFAPEAPAAAQLYVQSLLTPQLSAVALLVRVVRVQRRGDGRYEVGAAFADGPETLAHTRNGISIVRLDG